MSEHVRLGGSKAHRFLVCHASPRLEELAGPQASSPAAAEGTAAHYVGERCNMLRCHTDKFLGQTVQGHEVTVDMAEAVQVYVDWLENIRAASPKAKVLLEQNVTLAALNPPEEMRGSADCIVLLKDLKTMIVADYKHGKGHVVEVKGNKQTRYYALAAFLSLPLQEVQGIERVQMTIIQPRAWHADGPIRSETVDLSELLDFADDILSAAEAIQKPDAKAVPGDHCLFCAAAGSCHAKANAAVAAAQGEFAVVKQHDPRFMPTDQLAALVRLLEPRLDEVTSWVKSAREALHAKAMGGEEVPGFKLVAKRATRVWADTEKVKAWALLDAGLAEKDILTTPELLSPAQMEKLVGKKNLPAELTVSVSSGYNLASADSNKPAARISAADEFSTVN